MIKNQPIESFNPNWKQPSPAPSSLQMNRPYDLPHEKYVSLSNQDKRFLCHKNDLKMVLEDCFELTVGFYQSKYKVPKHGAIHNVEYIIKPDGSTKSLKNDNNALKLMHSVANMPFRKNVKIFKNAIYKPGTERQFEAIFYLRFRHSHNCSF